MSNETKGQAPDDPRRLESEERLRRLGGLPGERDFAGQPETKASIPYLETRDVGGRGAKVDTPDINAERERAATALKHARSVEERDAIRREHSNRMGRPTAIEMKG